MDKSIRLAGISGSLRKGSYNTMLLNSVASLIPEDVAIDIIPFTEVPVYNADLDTPTESQRPESVRKFRDAIAAADGLVIVSPEYNYSIPGGLKNALDWASRGGKESPLFRKPVALMGASPGQLGTARMQMAFYSMFLAMNMNVVLKPEVLVSQAAKKFDDQGNLIDEKAKDLIRKKIDGLLQLIRDEQRVEH